MDETPTHYAKRKKPDAKEMYDFIQMCRKGKSIEIEIILVVSWDWGQRWGLAKNKHKRSSWDVGNILKLDYGNDYTTP